jgi:hypothetical protein
VNIAGRSSGGRTNATANNKPGEHLRASRPRLLLIHVSEDYLTRVGTTKVDLRAVRTLSIQISTELLEHAPPLGIKVERSRFSSFAASRLRR